MKSPDRQDSQLSIGEEAARWLCELQEGDREQRAEFLAWLRRSPRHVEEFLFTTAMWRQLHRFGHSQPERLARLIAAAEAVERDGLNVVPLQERHPRSSFAGGQGGQRRWQVGSATAASIVIAAAGLLWLLVNRAPTYATEVGEQRVVQLDDGSRVDLNTRTRIAVQFSEQARDIRLVEGEALFTVAKDPSRPFRVDVDGTVIQALGTQFNVYRKKNGAKVSVIAGAVQIAPQHDQTAPAKLTAGEEAQVVPGKAIAKRTASEIADTVAWRERRLIFRADRLEDVVAEVNRYSRHPIRIADDAARAVRLTAIFDADDPESLVRFLREMDGLSVETTSREFIVRANDPQSPVGAAANAGGLERWD